MFLNKKRNLQVDMNFDDDEEEEDENRELKEFYMSNLHLFFNCPMKLIGDEFTRKIALKLDATNVFDDDWKKYATAMGIDNDTIIEIMIGARCRRDQEVFIAMDRVIGRFGTFGHIVCALLKTRRLDVLKYIEDFVRYDLLPKISTPCKDESNRKDPSIPPACSMTCKNETCSEEHCVKKNSAPLSGQKCDLNFFQQRSVKGYFKSGLSMSNSFKISGERLEEIPLPSAPEEEKITVLIPHTESKRRIAEDLQLEFFQNGVLATTLTEVVNSWLHFGREIVLDAVFSEVDFIVPIVCSEFLEEISPRNHDQHEESDYAKSNTYLHRLIMNEYSDNKYINLRVRPVIVPEMDRRCIREIIYKFSFKLPKEVPKLIQVLKETKDIKNTMVHQINK